MNRLLTLAAVIETATGLALMAMPSVVVRLLLGGEIAGASIPLGRAAGFALLAQDCLRSLESSWVSRYTNAEVQRVCFPPKRRHTAAGLPHPPPQESFPEVRRGTLSEPLAKERVRELLAR